MHPCSSDRRAAAFAVDTYSYTLHWRARDCLERLSRLGFREFELQMYPGHLWPAHAGKAERRELKELVAGNGWTIATLNMPNIDLNIAAAAEEMRGMTLGILRDVVALAGDLGVEAVVIGPGKANPLLPMAREKLIELFYRGLDELVPFAENHGTHILVENMPFAFLPRIDELLHALDEYGNSSIGVVYDVANSHFMKENVAHALRACAPRLRAIHLSDTDQNTYRHAAVGLGTVDFGLLPDVITEIGFSRRPILEIISPDPDPAIEDSARRLFDLGFQPLNSTTRDTQ